MTSSPDAGHQMVDGSPPDPTVGTADAARRLGVTASYVRQLIAAGEVPATRVGRAWRITTTDLNALAARRGTPARTPGPVAQPTPVVAQPAAADEPLAAEDAFAIERALLQADNEALQRRLAETQLDGLQTQLSTLRAELDARDQVITTLLAARTATNQ